MSRFFSRSFPPAVAFALLLVFIGVYAWFVPRMPPRPAVVGNAPERLWAFSQNPIPVPPLARVTVESDRSHYFLGENPLLHLTVKNIGRLPFPVSAGGDYRGGTRADRFQIKVNGPQGTPVADPMPEQSKWGGMGSGRTLQAGESTTISAALMRYAMIEVPGTYRIEISHDLGWQTTPDRPIPVTNIQLQFDQPDVDAARAVIADISARRGGPTINARTQPYGDYTSLRHPIYLPLLKARATAGEAMAVAGIGHVKGRQATAALVTLAAAPESSAEVRLTAMDMLAARAPHPTQRLYHVPNLVISPDHLREGAWDEDLEASTRRLARMLASKDDPTGLALTARALDLLAAYGGPEDASRVLTILDACLGRADFPQGMPEGQNQLLNSSLYALRALSAKGWSAPASPVSPAEIYLVFHLASRGELPAGDPIERLALANLAHPNRIVRRTAYEAVSRPVPEAALDQVRADLVTEHQGLLNGVLGMIVRTNDRRLSTDLLHVLEHNRDRHRQGQLVGRSLELAGPEAVIPLLISQLAHPEIAEVNLDELIRLFFDRQPHGVRPIKWADQNPDALRAAWQEFFTRYQSRILDRQKLSPDKPYVPQMLFAGRYDW